MNWHNVVSVSNLVNPLSMSCFNPNLLILCPIKYQLCKAAVKFTVFQTNLVKSRVISTLINSSILRHPNQPSTKDMQNIPNESLFVKDDQLFH